MAKIGDLWIKLKLKAEEFKNGLKAADESTKEFADGIKALKASSVAIWAAIAAGAYKMADAFAHTSQTIGDVWDSTMTRLQTKWQAFMSSVTRNITGHSEKSLGQQVLQGFLGPIWGTLFGPGSKAAGQAGKAMAQAQDAMTEIDYAFRLSMAEEQPELHQLYLKMMNSALSASDREAAASEYRQRIERIYAPRVKGLKDVMDKTVQQYLAIGGVDSGKYTAEQTKDLIKMMSSDPEKVEREYKDFFNAYQSIGDTVSGNLVQTMEAYYGATNEMNNMLKRVDRTAQNQANAGLDELVKKLGKADDGLAEFRKQVSEEAEAMAADEAFQDMADPLEEFEATHADVLDRMTHKQQVFADMAQEAYEKAARAAMEYEQAEQEASDMADDAAQTALDNLQAKMDRAAELNQALSDTLVASISDSTQAFSDMLFGLEGADASAVLGALLQPFANMAKQLGEMLIAEGIGIAAFKESLKSLNPAVALAAGAALVALGAALSSGIQKLGSSGGGSGASATSAGSAGSTTAATDISTEMTIYVKGKVSGKDILISGDNARNYYGR